MKKLLFGTMMCGAIFLGACNGNSSETTTSDSTHVDMDSSGNMTNNSGSLSENDRDFAQEATRGGKMEVALGEVAQKNSTNQDIKDFGKMMVDDHSAANSELTALLNKKGVTIDGSYTNDQNDHLKKLTDEKGKDFDKDYVDMMVKDHKEDIELFKKASENANDPELKNFASKTLPTLQKHLDAIQKIKDNMK